MITTSSDLFKISCIKCKGNYLFSVPLMATQEEANLALDLCKTCRKSMQPERLSEKTSKEDAIV